VIKTKKQFLEVNLRCVKRWIFLGFWVKIKILFGYILLKENLMSEQIKIGLIGIGTVGSGVLETLIKNLQGIKIKKIADKDTSKINQYPELRAEIFTTDANEIINDPEIQIVVELIGGVNPAYDFIKRSIQNKKHIVTANKELIAKHGKDLFQLAQDNNVVILYEAAVGGGIPIIMPLRLSLSGNNITKIAGILNGTTNYILTKMESEGASFEEVLKEAQKLGYAEADPTGDVQGHDSAYKTAILATLGFHKRINIEEIYKEGIDKISPKDIKHSAEFGYRIKLIGLIQNGAEGTLDIRVHPMLVPYKHPLASINDVLNGIVVEGNPIGRVMFSGPGAGKFPTASSVTGDILAIAAELGKTNYPLPKMRCTHTENAEILDINKTKNKYYIRVTTTNIPGVIGDLGLICGKNKINLYGIVQKGILEDGSASIVLMTEPAMEENVRKAINEMKERPTVKLINNIIRVMD
jgi:homoserine dehydrogenase